MTATPTDESLAQITLRTLANLKQAGEKFACLTAYDASFATLLDSAGIEVILVGDSLGMVIQGHQTTIPVTMDQMVYHAECVSRHAHHALVMVDMPFMSYSQPREALANAARLMQQGGAQIVKLEGGSQQLPIVEALSGQGVPVCAHIGLQPQSVHKLGGYRVQGRDPRSAERMLKDAESLEQAGADLMLLECVPASLAQEITANLSIPVIGIGAGAQTDAQVLVLQDVLGITPGTPPRFSRNFLQHGGDIRAAILAYREAVRQGTFPGPEHSFS
jgi:3-methyl-2-oxobutanoate hydroxymethyltransferase